MSLESNGVMSFVTFDAEYPAYVSRPKLLREEVFMSDELSRFTNLLLRDVRIFSCLDIALCTLANFAFISEVDGATIPSSSYRGRGSRR